MSEYGLKIKNFEAGSLYSYNLGVRNNYDYTNAMFTNSLFSDFLIQNGLSVWKGRSTRDIICIEFNYGSRSYEEEMKHLQKLIKEVEGSEDISEDDKARQLSKLGEIVKFTEDNQNKFDKKSL